MNHSATEALTNATIGLLVSWAITYLALPLWGLTTTPAQAGGITAMYFTVSFARSWVIREVFRRVWD